MNTDSINVEDSTLNDYLTKIINSCYNNLMNPFFKVKIPFFRILINEIDF